MDVIISLLPLMMFNYLRVNKYFYKISINLSSSILTMLKRITNSMTFQVYTRFSHLIMMWKLFCFLSWRKCINNPQYSYIQSRPLISFSPSNLLFTLHCTGSYWFSYIQTYSIHWAFSASDCMVESRTMGTLLCKGTKHKRMKQFHFSGIYIPRKHNRPFFFPLIP